MLGFVKGDPGYNASFEVTVNVQDSTGKLVSEKEWTEEIIGATFEESASASSYNLTQRSFEVPPGQYSVATAVRDLEIRTPMQQTLSITVPDYYNRRFALSGIMLVSKLTLTGEKRSIVPHISPNVGMLLDGFHAFIEVYDRESLQEVFLVTEVLND